MNTRRQCLHFHTHSGRGTRGRTRGGDRSARVFAGRSPCVGPRARGGGRRDVGRGEQLPRGSGGAVTGSCGRAGCQLPRSRVPVRCEQRRQREMSSGKADFPLQAAGLEVRARGSQPGCSREFTSSQFTERRPGSECRTARTDGSPADGGRCPAGAPRSGLGTRRLPGRGGRGADAGFAPSRCAAASSPVLGDLRAPQSGAGVRDVPAQPPLASPGRG